MHKLFIIGLGKRGLVHADVLASRQDVTIIGGFDASEEVRQKCKQTRDFLIYDDLNTGLKLSEPNFILITTPPDSRIKLFTQLAILHDIHTIIVEKPLALSMQEGMALYHQSLEKNWRLEVVHQSRFCDEFVALKNSIQEGRIGNLLFLKSSCYGNLFNQGSHAVDLIRWLTNGELVKWVDATGHDDKKILNPLLTYPIEVEPDIDHPGNLWSSITMRLQSGVEVFMTCGVLDAMPIPTHGPWLQRRIIAVGDEGVAYSHLSSYFKDVSLANPQQKKYLTTPNEYLSSLHRYYDHIFNPTRLNCNDQINTLNDHVFTLATLVATLASAKRHELIPLPTTLDKLITLDQLLVPTNEEKPYKTFHSVTEIPLISVIVPMETHRGMGEEAARSWIKNQSCDSYQYEVILVFHRYQQKFKEILEKNNKEFNTTFVCIDAKNELELCHYGATLAKGKFLLFTESHCIAEPKAVEEALKFFTHSSHDGFYPRTEHICTNTIAKMEAKFYEKGFYEFGKSDYWAKITLHAFGIKKEVYTTLGGFEHKYNRFATWLFGAKLHKMGFSLAYAPAVGVKHLFVHNLKLFEKFAAECLIGECQFRLDTQDSNYCYQFFGVPNEWNEASYIKPNLNKIISKHLYNLQACNHKLKDMLFSWNLYFAMKSNAYLGKNKLSLRYYFIWLKSKYRYFITKNNSERKWQHALDYFEKTDQRYRVKFAFSLQDDKKFQETNFYQLSKLNDAMLFGFHLTENFQEEEFRWSSKISAIRLVLTPDQNKVKIRMFHLRPLEEIADKVLFFFNNTHIHEIQFDFNNKEIYLTLPNKELAKHKKENWLIIFTTPWNSGENDKRQLGLPIHSIQLSAATR